MRRTIERNSGPEQLSILAMCKIILCLLSKIVFLMMMGSWTNIFIMSELKRALEII
jgi:hypothetical protein